MRTLNRNSNFEHIKKARHPHITTIQMYLQLVVLLR